MTSPAGTGTVDVTVTTPIGTSPTSSADHFTYTAAPTVTVVSPTSGPGAGGTTVTVTGTNLTNATAVDFGSANPGTITADTAALHHGDLAGRHGNGQDITVTTAGGTSATSSADHFTYIPAPTVTVVSPTTGPAPGGTTRHDHAGTNLAERHGGRLRERQPRHDHGRHGELHHGHLAESARGRST